MTSDLCSDDVVVQIATPQMISTEGGGAGAGAGAGGARATGGAGAELGRRLLAAARAGDTAQVLELMAAGAPFSTDWLGTSPLHLAAAHAHADTCAVLLRAGVSRDARTKVERTPLQLAAAGGHCAAARVLLQAGADVHCRDMLHMTALHWAAARGHTAAARALLQAGADPLALSKFRKTPLQLARAAHVAELVRLLEDVVKQREAQRSVDALVTEEMTGEAPSEAQTRLFETVQRIEVIPPHTQAETTKSKVQPEKPNKTEKSKTETKESSSSAAAQLLRQHGITLLPTDDGSTVLSALQSGRTVVLSDAGKLMLKESGEPPPAAKPPILVKLPATARSGQSGKSPESKSRAGGVVLTATPVASPPRGVKVFTLNNKLALRGGGGGGGGGKLLGAHDLQQVKIVQLPSDSKLRCPSRIVPMKARSRAAPVRIVVSRADLSQVSQAVRQEETREESEEPTEPAALRAALAQAQRTVAALRGQLLAARAKLARYEGDEH